jgi:hypothetical protein
MKVKIFIFLLIAAAFVAGCASAPKSESDAQEGDILSRVQDARESAVAAGADERYPETLSALDASLAANQKKNAKLEDLLLRYQALEQASAAADKKERVDGQNFAQYDGESYREGEESLAAFDAADKEKGPAAELLATAKKANDSYDAVLLAGRRETARQAIARAEQRAKEVEDFAVEADAIAPLDAAQGGEE